MSDWKNNIKSKLEERDIQPSSSAWETLDAQLIEHQENNKRSKMKNKLPFLLRIAASLILIALAVWLMWNNSIVTDDVYEKPLVSTEKNDIPPPEVQTEPKIEITSENIIEKESTPTKNYAQVKYQNNKTTTQEIDISTPIDTTLGVKNIEFKEPKALAIEKKYIPNEHREIESVEILSADELLNQALKNRRLIKEKHIAVDGIKLLNEVEEELFEVKSPDLLEKLTHQVKSIQMALSERNQQK